MLLYKRGNITSNLQCRGSEKLNIREAHEGDYPELRMLYLESRRNTFVWDNIIEMTLEDFDISIRRTNS